MPKPQHRGLPKLGVPFSYLGVYIGVPLFTHLCELPIGPCREFLRDLLWAAARECAHMAKANMSQWFMGNQIQGSSHPPSTEIHAFANVFNLVLAFLQNIWC